MSYFRNKAVAREQLGIDSGTYTPTLIGVSNLDAATAYECQYIQIASVVTVTGSFDVNPTTAGATTRIRVTIPIASNFSTTEQCSGVVAALAAVESGVVVSDPTNDAVDVYFVAVLDINHRMGFTFAYRVI